MKKLVLSIMMLMAGAVAFAGSWNPKDLANDKKVEKLVEKYEMTELENSDYVRAYKSADSLNWIYIYTYGTEESNLKSIYKACFACLDGKFDSLYLHGGFTSSKEHYKFMYAGINEKSTIISNNDFYGHSKWTWTTPQPLFCSLFTSRQYEFSRMKKFNANYGFIIPETALAKYEYFSTFGKAHDYKLLSAEIKKYAKEHPEK